MRAGIIEHLPEWSRDSVILVLGHPGLPGMGFLKKFIADLNQEDTWIRAEFSDSASLSRVSERVKLALTMHGMSGSTITAVRKFAKTRDISCPPLALTVGEVKAVLVTLNRRRKGETASLVSSGVNGTHAANGHDETAHTVLVESHPGSEASSEPAPESIQVVAPEPVEERVVPPPPSNSPVEALQKLAGAVEEAQIAMLFIQDERTKLVSECEGLRQSLAAKDAEIEAMKTSHAAEIAGLGAELERLRALEQRISALISGKA